VLDVIHVPVIVGNKNLFYIDVENGIVLGQNLTILFLMDEFELWLFKNVDIYLYVCKQKHSLLSSLVKSPV
jgi:hypothetical protein